MAIDVVKLSADIQKAMSETLGRDVPLIRSFSARQLEAIAQHVALIEKGIESGEITEATREYFLDSLEDMTLNFVKTFRGLQAVTVEKAYNAIVTVIWKVLKDLPGVPSLFID